MSRLAPCGFVIGQLTVIPQQAISTPISVLTYSVKGPAFDGAFSVLLENVPHFNICIAECKIDNFGSILRLPVVTQGSAQSVELCLSTQGFCLVNGTVWVPRGSAQ